MELRNLREYLEYMLQTKIRANKNASCTYTIKNAPKSKIIFKNFLIKDIDKRILTSIIYLLYLFVFRIKIIGGNHDFK